MPGGFLKFCRKVPASLTGPLSVRPSSGHLHSSDVSFCYTSNERVLENVSFQILKGEVVAIVGPSGEGKSTMVNLLLRFFDPDTGAVLLDGKDIKEFKQAKYRRLFGVMAQETMLFDASIKDNISYGRNRDEVTEQELIQAAPTANAHGFISAFPDQYATMVGDRGGSASGLRLPGPSSAIPRF